MLEIFVLVLAVLSAFQMMVIRDLYDDCNMLKDQFNAQQDTLDEVLEILREIVSDKEQR